MSNFSGFHCIDIRNVLITWFPCSFSFLSLSLCRSETQKKKPRKPKGKVVPSRYLSSTKSTPSVSNKTLSTSSATATINKTQQLSKKTSRVRHQLPVIASCHVLCLGKSAQRPGRKDSSRVSSRGSSSGVAPSSSLSTALPRHPFTPSGTSPTHTHNVWEES